MRDAADLLVLAVGLLLFFTYLRWAVRDAARRRKSGFLVVIAVVFFFPFGLVAWLLFRPPVSAVERNWADRGVPVVRR